MHSLAIQMQKSRVSLPRWVEILVSFVLHCMKVTGMLRKFQLLLTTSAGLCLHRSGNLGTAILVSPVHECTAFPLCSYPSWSLGHSLVIIHFPSDMQRRGGALQLRRSSSHYALQFRGKGESIHIEQGQKSTSFFILI